MKTELVLREYDGRWELIGLIDDPENDYFYKDETGKNACIKSQKWVTLKVYDFIMEEK